jgi:methionyl-tRNA formyltransferase
MASPKPPWRVAIITVLPIVAQNYSEVIRELGHEPVSVITPRRRTLAAPPMPFAAAHVADDPAELDILFAATKHSLAALLRTHAPDLAICTGFPWLIPQVAIDVPRLGIVNGHPSMLPRYRGPFPIAWAVRNGEREIGMTYHLMDAAFDTGNVLAQTSIPLGDDETEETLFERFPAVVSKLLPIVFERLAAGDRGDPQEGGEYQSMFEEGYWWIDPSRPAAEVHRQVRAWSFIPPIAPGLGPVLERDGERIRVTHSSLTEVAGATVLACGDGPLWIVESEPAQPVPPGTAFR